MQSNIPSI